MATACTQGKRTQHGKPRGVVRDDQPEAREGQAGRPGVAERLVVPLKPGNAGGGKGPQFKTDARRGEGPGDWATYQLRIVFRSCRRRYTRKRRQKPAIASTPCTTRFTEKTSWPMRMPQCRSNEGAPGVDGQDFADVEAYGVQRWLGELALALREESYRPDPIRRVFIPKANGKLRPLGISTLRDRVCMTAAMLVLEPIFEADLPSEQYAYRPGRNAQQAVVEVEDRLFRGHPEVVDADLADYFGQHSTPRTNAVGSASHRGSARAASDQDVAGVPRGRNRPTAAGRHARPRPKTSGAASRKAHPSHHCWPIFTCAGLCWGGRSSGWSDSLGSRIVTYADDLVILCRQRQGGRSLAATARDHGQAEAHGQRGEDTDLQGTGRGV